MAKFLVPISNFEFWPVKNRSKSFKICHWVLLCLSCSCTVLDTVCSPAIPATVLIGAASTRRPSRLSAALHLADDLEASWAVPILLSPPQCTTSRARASSTERNRRRSSHRQILAAAARFVALQPTAPRPEARPALHERDRALPRPKSSCRRRPPLPISVELRPLCRAPSSGPPPLKIDPR